MEITLQSSKAKNKKFAAIIKTTDRKKTINFGDNRYEDYTSHGDVERK